MSRMPHLRAAVLCTVVILSGCHKKVRVAIVPPPPPPVMIGVPPLTHPMEPEIEMSLEDSAASTDLLPRQPVLRYRPSPLQQITIAKLPPPPLELGRLTTGEAAPLRQQTADLLRTQRQRLDNVAPAVAALHTHQMQQARTFLRQADEAWKKLDVEGARTLATKAKVLLDELPT